MMRRPASLIAGLARRWGVLPPPLSTPGGSFLRCAPPAATDALRNALSRSAPQAAAILRSGVRSATDVSVIVDAVSTSKRPAQLDEDLPVDGVYAGVTQYDLYNILFSTGATLAAGGYHGHGDAASKTLLGPRGIGKTTALRAYAAVAPLFEPALVPIYITFIGNGTGKDGASYMGRSSVLEMAADALAVYGIFVSGSLDSIVDGLTRHNKYALLLLDEVDKFYESQGIARHGDNYAARFSVERQTLGELASMGNDARGRLAVLLCGSSSLLGDLVTTNLRGLPEATEAFPVLRVAININGQKFRTTRLTYSPPTDFTAVATMMRQPGALGLGSVQSGSNGDGARLAAIVNAVLFCTGATARNVSRLTSPKVPLAVPDLSALLVNESPQAGRTLQRPISKMLYNGIMRDLAAKNSALLTGLVGQPNGALNFAAVTDGEWRHKFQPLTWSEVCSIAQDVPDLPFEVAYLFDRDYIAYGDGVTAGGLPRTVYPYTLLQLLAYGKSGRELEQSILVPILAGLNSPQLRGPSAWEGTAKAERDSLVREGAKDLYGQVKESLRDLAQRLNQQLPEAVEAGQALPLTPFSSRFVAGRLP